MTHHKFTPYRWSPITTEDDHGYIEEPFDWIDIGEWTPITTLNKRAGESGKRETIIVDYDLFQEPHGPIACVTVDERAGPDYEISFAELRSRVFKLIDATPNLDWVMFTERPGNVEKMMPMVPMHMVKGRENLFLGVDITTQAEADERIPQLLKIPAAKRIVRVRPGEEIDLGRYTGLSGMPSKSGRCANCGRDDVPEDSRRYDEFYDGEFACSEKCERQHIELGCPLENKPIDAVIVEGADKLLLPELASHFAKHGDF